MRFVAALVCAFAQPARLALAQSGNGDVVPGISRTEGVDSASSIRWIRLTLDGKTVKGNAGSAGAPLLIAQCTLHSADKYRFEMFSSFGDATDLAFYPPWKPASPQDLFAPRTDKVSITMEFLGYTRVKPLRRQWEVPVQTPGLYRYNPPGSGSPNLEEIAYDLRYLLALPIVRLSLADRSAEFAASPLIAQIRREPLCRAAGL